MIATDQIGGPGKGVLQLLQHAPTEAFRYVLCGFDLEGTPVGEFVDEARRKQLNLALLQQGAAFDPRLVTQARRIVLEHDINIIQTHGYKSNTIGFFLRLLCRRPWIGFAHGYIDDNRRNRLYNRIDRFVLRRADRVVAVSGSMKALLTRHGVEATKIRVVYNAVDLKETATDVSIIEMRARHGIAPDQKVIGVIGRLSPEKGQMDFLKAMEHTVGSVPGAKALIIGDGQDRAMLERYSRERGLGAHVLFLGHQEKIARYYQILDLLVLPSLSEGLPNAVLEAMSFGVPVLATAVGGVPEVIQDGNGVVVPPGDHAALANEMIVLLRDDALRRAIGGRGRRSLYPRFSAADRAREMVRVYDELLSDRFNTQ